MSRIPCHECLILGMCLGKKAEDLLESCEIFGEYMKERKYHNNLQVLRTYNPTLELVFQGYTESLAIIFTTSTRKYVLTW